MAISLTNPQTPPVPDSRAVSFWQTAPGQLLSSTWFLPTVGAGLSVRRSLSKKRSPTSLVLHAAGSAVAVYVGAIALSMSGLLEDTGLGR